MCHNYRPMVEEVSVRSPAKPLAKAMLPAEQVG